jgi:2-polyprenyl-3-methyl-5-hydroxy-6-metoxy-1,4-benzoquinol methylase
MHREVSTTTEYTIADQERMKAAPNYFQWQARLAKAELGRRVLEVGCGMGNFSEHLRDRDLVIGVDVDENCVARWKERFADRPHYRGFLLNAEAPEFCELKRHGIDSIVCLNVLEHIDKHELVLGQMREVLTAGGRVVLIVPAFESLYGEIDAKLGHYRRYTRKSLAAVAVSAGFSLKRLRYMNLVGFFGWWANARIFHRSEQSVEQIAFFDSRVVPVMSRLETLVPPPVGQSIIAVLEKI